MSCFVGLFESSSNNFDLSCNIYKLNYKINTTFFFGFTFGIEKEREKPLELEVLIFKILYNKL